MSSKIPDTDIKKILDSPYDYANKIAIDKLVDILKKLAFHYYNTSEELVPDEIYDVLRSVLEERDPKNKFITQVGAPVAIKDVVKLPYVMASLDKIKPSTNTLDSWKQKYLGPYVVSDKLDGVSGLLVKKGSTVKLYTRGDGQYGQDITHLIPYIITKKSLSTVPDNVAIRGEIIISKSNFKKVDKQFKNARNAVAGLVNSKHYSVDLAKITEFIGYTVLSPKYTAKEQMEHMEEWKFPLVTYKNAKASDLTNDLLSKYLIERREASKYEIDGIVVVDSTKAYDLTQDNPEYAFAFKTILTDQIAEATVLDVMWQASKYGYLKPRIRIKPIDISGVTIEYATAFNAKYVNDNKLGPGAIIKLVRSGDVIPHILEVTKPSANGKAKMPDIPFKWTETGVDIIVQDIHGEAKNMIIIKQLTSFFRVLDVKYISEGIITKLVEHGYDSVVKIVQADEKDLITIEGVGTKLVTKIFDNIDQAFKTVTLSQLMTASNKFGRGLGVKKFNTILKTYPNILTEKLDKKALKQNIIKLEGFDDITATQFVEGFDDFKKFFYGLEKAVDLTHLKKKVTIKKSKKKGKLEGMKIVFTGFRNGDLEDYINEEGGSVTGTVSKNTDIVIYADTSSSKYTKAKELNIKLMTYDEFTKIHGK